MIEEQTSLFDPTPYIYWHDVDGYTRPTKAFYEQHSRSEHLRLILVEITKGLARLVFDEDFSTSDEEKAVIRETLIQKGQELTALKIRPHMKAGRKKEYYRDPVNMAEYVAGQLLPYTGVELPTKTQVAPIVQELDEGDGLIENDGRIPERLVEYFVSGWIVKNAMDFLAAEEEGKI